MDAGSVVSSRVPYWLSAQCIMGLGGDRAEREGNSANPEEEQRSPFGRRQHVFTTEQQNPSALLSARWQLRSEEERDEA
ncbi:unnamed protein product [Arctogadus glacialis]